MSVGPRLGTRGWAALGAVVSFSVALVARGRLHPDELFQALEPAHGLAFGYAEYTWEWDEGVRNWAVPGLLAGVLRVATQLGADRPRELLAAVWAVGALGFGLGTAALYRWVEARDGDRAAALAAALYVSWGGLLVYAARPLSDALCLMPLLWGLERLDRARATGAVRDGLLAGLGLGLAVVVRYGSAVFVPVAALVLLSQRRWAALVGVALSGAGVLGALALLDTLTWGAPLHSLFAYAAYNQPGGRVGGHGTAPFWYYLPIYAGMAPLFLLPAMVQGLRGLRRLDLPALSTLTYALLVTLHPHKEPRFLLPLLPLGAVLAARTALQWADWLRPRRAALAGAALLYGAWSVASGTVLLPVGLRRDLLDAVASCGERPETAGLLLSTRDGWNSAGRFFLHRTSPIFLAEAHSAEELGAALRDPRYGCAVLEGHGISPEALAMAGWRREHDLGAAQRWVRP